MVPRRVEGDWPEGREAHMSCTPCVPSYVMSKLYKYGREVAAIFRFVVQFYSARTVPVQCPYSARTVPVHSARQELCCKVSKMMKRGNVEGFKGFYLLDKNFFLAHTAGRC